MPSLRWLGLRLCTRVEVTTFEVYSADSQVLLTHQTDLSDHQQTQIPTFIRPWGELFLEHL